MKVLKVQTFFQSITIEPVIFLSTFAWSLIAGAEITKKLIMFQICSVGLNLTNEACENVTAMSTQTEKITVQEDLNNLLMRSQFISSAPAIVYSVIAGALSDEFGRKPLILLPLFGFFSGYLLNTIHYSLLNRLPLEFFYTDNVAAFFGGMPIYYLGIYSYCTSATRPEERAHRLARLDGIETVAKVIGTLLSPLVFKHFGYFGNYGLALGLTSIAILYLLLFAKEPLVKTSKPKSEEKSSSIKMLKYFLMTTLIQPLKAMTRLFTVPRGSGMKVVISLLLFCYALYSLAFQVDFHVRYLYMFLRFSPLHEEDYAHFMVTMNLVSAFCLVVLMPILIRKFGIEDSLIGATVLLIEITSCIGTPFVQTFWQFYLIQSFGAFGHCKFSLLRSLMSKCIEENEVGKMFSLLAMIAAVAPLLANPVFRQLYNQTLETFPGSVFHLASSLLLIAMVLNLFIYKRQKLQLREEKDLDVKNTMNKVEEMTIVTC